MFPIRFESRTIQIDPWRVREFRGGEGPPVALIHGLSGSFDWWTRNREVLARDHTVVAIDLIGFGSDQRFVGSSLPLDFADSTALLARWIRDFVGDSAHVVGHSMGGQLAIHLAATHPELVRSLVLVSSSGLPIDLKPGPHLDAMFHPPGSLPSFLPVLLRDVFRAGPTSIGVALARIFRDDVRDLLPHLTMPATLIWGDNDPFVPLRYARILDEEIPQSRLVVIPGAGHVPMWDQPDRFNEVVLGHLATVEQAQPLTEPEPAFNWAIQSCDEGICHRASGTRKDVVLIHGLGIRSEYFRGLARSLWDAGLHAVAPDLPGFGFSQEQAAWKLEELVDRMHAWAARLGIRDALWIGHSTGAQVVEHLMRRHPSLVRRAIFVSPIWNAEPHSMIWLAQSLVRDTPREPLQLVAIAVRAYWEAGMIRFFRAFRQYARDAGQIDSLPKPSVIVYGEEDPMVHRDFLAGLGAPVHVVPGAHGVVFSHPDEIAAVAVGAAKLKIEN